MHSVSEVMKRVLVSLGVLTFFFLANGTEGIYGRLLAAEEDEGTCEALLDALRDRYCYYKGSTLAIRPHNVTNGTIARKCNARGILSGTLGNSKENKMQKQRYGIKRNNKNH
ncbi:unnamed protein product [Strongylus vulgaris]|uniref:Uncharacterized protein n=1 Tax=Strongylus vulgaris TaxID=40348 RepID=A0A3P7IK70_STRVU|nr:unnamed protein product [Strongylus vulgaris]